MVDAHKFDRAGRVDRSVIGGRILSHLAEKVPADLEDPLPPELLARLRVVSRGEALRRVHQNLKSRSPLELLDETS